MPKPRLPLLVALDDALIRTPAAHEAFWAAVARDSTLPLRLGGALLLGGRSRLRAELARRAPPDAAHLPLRPEALALLKRWRRQRNAVILLAEPSDTPLAEALAAHFGLIDEVLALPPDPDARADALAERFGARGFAYLGASARDLPIWQAAGRVFSVGATATLRARLDALDTPAEHLRDRPATAQDWADALAAPGWAWNLAVFLALLGLAPGTDIAPALAPLAAVWLAFGMTGSGTALLRDLLRLEKLRATDTSGPVASGRVPFRLATPLALILPVAGVALAAPFGALVLAALALAAAGPIIAEEHTLGRLAGGVLFRLGMIALRPFAGLVALGVPLTL